MRCNPTLPRVTATAASVTAARIAVPVETSVPGFPVAPARTEMTANKTPRQSQAATPINVHPVAFLMERRIPAAVPAHWGSSGQSKVRQVAERPAWARKGSTLRLEVRLHSSPRPNWILFTLCNTETSSTPNLPVNRGNGHDPAIGRRVRVVLPSGVTVGPFSSSWRQSRR